ncbi:MAG: hypothetical protein ACRERV_04310, partial [Methylococcales bacterium]
EYTEPKSEYREGGYLDTQALKDLSKVEETTYKNLVGAAKRVIRPKSDAARAKWVAWKLP